MKNVDHVTYHRRGFLGLVVPACAMTCLALNGLPLAASGAAQTAGQPAPQGSPHPFDANLPRTLTWRQAFRMQNRGFALFALHLSKALGREKTVQLLQDWGGERVLVAAKNRVQQLGGNDFAALKKAFSPAAPEFANTLVFDVVESTDTVHEIKVTECLWAKTWRDEGAGEEGHAAVCHGDFAFARAFNPKIEMVRDQTLMQGHPCCNHRYLWKG